MEKLIQLTTEDSENVALWKITNDKSTNKHLFLIHGTFSDKDFFNGFTDYFLNLGYTCWALDWRNHGASKKTNKKFKITTIGKYDVTAAFRYLTATENINKLHCVAHSGGGIAITVCLVHHPEFKKFIKSITLFGVQAFGANTGILQNIKLRVAKLFSKLIGKVPAKLAGSKNNDETYFTMKQWFNWNIYRQFKDSNHFDYEPEMKEIKIPIISFCAKGDDFIAPKEGCQLFLDAFQNPKNELVYCAKELGNLEDYNHSRILKSRNSMKELWPKAAAWMQTHS
ncbi:alpha/beta fold hydrolase [Polaribacter sp. MED152]|uniref:alpha/beta fold hydrolase n=1 Tax=Polaribacter sp. MED152 TaxID=313598 RepID=UPI000068C8CA|nr:alpha/beta fold hydrolase [Polaribacter sp. MED152]EAQ41622.1 alpha/beta hydrolase [Polaribacter sp. MED152]